MTTASIVRVDLINFFHGFNPYHAQGKRIVESLDGKTISVWLVGSKTPVTGTIISAIRHYSGYQIETDVPTLKYVGTMARTIGMYDKIVVDGKTWEPPTISPKASSSSYASLSTRAFLRAYPILTVGDIIFQEIGSRKTYFEVVSVVSTRRKVGTILKLLNKTNNKVNDYSARQFTCEKAHYGFVD